LRVQPCFSLVWDTALTLNALADAGQPSEHQAIQNSVRWLLEREVRRPGDRSVSNPGLEPGGWFFEYRNGLYPDTDDTAMVLMALAKTGNAMVPAERGAQSAARTNGARSGLGAPALRGLRWLLHMQNRDSGW